MPAVQHLTGRRQNDRTTQIRLVDISRVLCNGAACRLDIQWATEPSHFVKSIEFTKPNFFDRETLGQFPELVHSMKAHRTIRFRRLARTSGPGALVLGFLFALLHRKGSHLTTHSTIARVSRGASRRCLVIGHCSFSTLLPAALLRRRPLDAASLRSR